MLRPLNSNTNGTSLSPVWAVTTAPSFSPHAAATHVTHLSLDADLVVRPADVTISKGHAAPLKIYAPGTVRHVGTVNGQELDTPAGKISVPWVHGIPSTAATVTNRPLSLTEIRLQSNR